jgi:GT2 family glycosyltransferase
MEETCIIIPTFNKYNIVKKHIALLENQTYKKFDIVIVDSGKSNDHVQLQNLNQKNLYVLYFKKDLGGSGSFYEGLKFCCSKGYKYMVLADNDALPISRNLVYKLIYNLKLNGTACVPTNINESFIYRQHRKNIPISEYAFHYVTISKEMVKKVGLPRKDLFIFFDDVDYTRRISQKFGLVKLNNVFYSHPFGIHVFIEKVLFKPRIYYNIRNNLLISSFAKRFAFLLIWIPIIFISYLFNILSNKPQNKKNEINKLIKVFIKAVLDGFLLKSGKIKEQYININITPSFNKTSIEKNKKYCYIYREDMPKKLLLKNANANIKKYSDRSIKGLLYFYVLLRNKNFIISEYEQGLSFRLLLFILRGNFYLFDENKKEIYKLNLEV